MKRYVNLIPIASRKHQLTVKQLRFWAVTWGCTLAIGCMLCSQQQSNYHALHQQVLQLDRQYEPIREIGKKSELALNEIQSQRTQVQWLRSLEQADVPLITLAAIHQSVDSLYGRVQLERLRFEGLDAPASLRPNTPQVANASQPQSVKLLTIPVNNQIELYGYAIDDDAVSELISHLEGTGLFAKVELIGIQGQGELRRDFQIRCRVQAEVEQLEELAGTLNGTSVISTASGQHHITPPR